MAALEVGKWYIVRDFPTRALALILPLREGEELEKGWFRCTKVSLLEGDPIKVKKDAKVSKHRHCQLSDDLRGELNDTEVQTILEGSGLTRADFEEVAEVAL